ncbi:MAG: hypothetical protein HW383_410 [Candidatus Magasanikbacteria bacterium]|nr:hypothetical protein [Candidatus Magasanikbacteria bacterium]
MGFSEQLAEMKAKEAGHENAQKEAIEKSKAEAEAEAKAAAQSREAQRGEFSAERKRVTVEVSAVEKAAGDARSAVAETESFVSGLGKNAAPDVVAMLESIKVEAAQAEEQLVRAKQELARVDGEMALLETATSPVEEKAVEPSPEGKASATEEKAPAESPEDAVRRLNAEEVADQKDFKARAEFIIRETSHDRLLEPEASIQILKTFVKERSRGHYNLRKWAQS